MLQSLTYLDLSVLMGMGFKFGITDEVLWGTDKNGTEWQVIVEPTFLIWNKYDPKTKRTESGRRMSHEEFDELFR